MADTRLTDGQLDWSNGVNSAVIKTKAIGALPHGVKPSQLCWLINGNVRTGGILPRPAVNNVVLGAPWSGLYQGGLMYQPDSADPFLLLAIGGTLWKVRVDTDNSVHNLSASYGLSMPSSETQAFFSQSEMFAIWQAGDLTTKPVFYDSGIDGGLRNETMRRSNGFVGVNNITNEIPPAGPMDYYAQRLWYAFGRNYAAGDIVRNKTSGTGPYEFRDSVLHVTENPVATGGDAFVVPTTAGNIRALAHASNLDTALGESQLFVFTRRAIYACAAPITRDAWTKTTNDFMPLQKVVLNKGGAYSARAVVAVNGDLFFQGPPDGDIRSIQTSLRYFGQWGNVPLSNNEQRVLSVNDRSLLNFATGIQYDNRLFQSALPIQTPVGVAHQAVIPLDFDIISTLEERQPPSWEGVYDFSAGPYILQMFEGDFGGVERAFAVVWSVIRQAIEVVEFRKDLRFDNGDDRITRVIEFPAYSFNNPFQLKELDTAELWIDKMLGTVNIEVYYRPDAWACWIPWTAFSQCAARDCRESIDDPCADNGYPHEPFCEQDRATIMLPKIQHPQCIPGVERPSTWGYQFQVRLAIKGWCRVRGFLLHAIPREKRAYEGISMACAPVSELL